MIVVRTFSISSERIRMNSNENPKDTDREVYILRYWRDLTLRGQITHVRSGMTFPLRDPEVLLALIQEQAKNACSNKKPSGLK